MPNPRTQIFSMIFFSVSFMVLGFTYSTVIHFELVLAYGVTSGLIGPLLLKKIYRYPISSCYNTTYCKVFILPFSTELTWHFCQNTSLYTHICTHTSSVFDFAFSVIHWSICVSFYQYYSLGRIVTLTMMNPFIYEHVALSFI